MLGYYSRMEQLRNIDEHEIEHLVPEEQTAHIPSVTPDHLDTKASFFKLINK